MWINGISQTLTHNPQLIDFISSIVHANTQYIYHNMCKVYAYLKLANPNFKIIFIFFPMANEKKSKKTFFPSNFYSNGTMPMR